MTGPVPDPGSVQDGSVQPGSVDHGAPVLSAKDVAVYFPIGSALAARIKHEQRFMHAVDGVDLELGGGEAMALVGESGTGKSTFALAMAGMCATNQGEIAFQCRQFPDR